MNYFEIIGIVSVVISLLFVAYQIQQSNKIAKVTTEYEIRNNHSSSNEVAMSDQAFATLLFRATDPSFKPEGGELAQLIAFTLRSVNFWAAAGTAYENGLLTDDTYEFVLDDIRNFINNMPGLHSVVNTVLAVYPSLKKPKIIGVVHKTINGYSHREPGEARILQTNQ